MILVLLIGLVFVGLSFGLFARTLLLSRSRAAEALRHIETYGFNTSPRTVSDEHQRRRRPKLMTREVFDALASRFGNLLSRRLKNATEARLEQLLRSAGFYSLSPRRFIGYQMLATLTLGALFLWLVLAGNVNPLLSLLVVIIGLLGGWSLPLLFVKRRARFRGERIDYDMPELIDTLVATIEAGIAFSAALQVAARRFRGPLGEELRLTLQEQAMGLGLKEALTNMLERQDTRSVRAFVRSLIQGERMGVSVGQTLRNLSHDMRTLRRQLAEERAQKAPVKLVFPVILLILPALFVITLGPAALRIHSIFQ